MLLIGKPSISMGHLYHGYVSHNQMVTTWFTMVYHMISREFTDDSLPNKRHPPTGNPATPPDRVKRWNFSFKITRPGKLSQKTMERSTIFSGKISYKWQCSIVLLNYQRVMIGGTWIIPFYAMKGSLPSRSSSFWRTVAMEITINYH